MSSGATSKTVKVRTTLPKRPLPPCSQREAIKTARLTVRALCQDDLDGVHALRTQPEVMQRTAIGRIDKDMAETQMRLDRFLPPNDEITYNCAIYLTETGEFIGMGGAHKISFGFGWPEVGYMFKREHWGKGYATEFLKCFVEAYWQLEREEFEVEVDVASVNMDEQAEEIQTVPELLTAIVASNNPASLRVMEKVGFKEYKAWTEPDSRVGCEGIDIELVGFVLEQDASRL